MGKLQAVEIVYRGIFQKTLAKNLSRAIVLAAHRDGRPGISFGRYGDSPERNGIPAKSFAIVASDELTLEEGMAQYEPRAVDLTICLDDTLCKGVESWAWYGLQPVNRLLRRNGVLLVTSREEPAGLVEMIHRKDVPYRLAVLKATPSFSGLWVYKDDHTDVRVLGAVARLLPDLYGMLSLEAVIREEWKNPLKVASAVRAHERIETVVVEPTQGNPEKPYRFDLPKWHEMRDGVTIPAIPLGQAMDGAAGEAPGGYRPARNPTFKKFSTRTMRPVVNFDTCVKCTLCWLQCPDSCFDVTPDGLYDASLEACCGCGVCEAVCPEPDCITMVNEVRFRDNASQWQAWKRDPAAYRQQLAGWTADRGERSHGFRFRGQYEQQVPDLLAQADQR